MSAELPIDIFRSPRRADCEERALVLTAVGISSVITISFREFLLCVDPADVDAALAHLNQYESENRPGPPPPPPPRPHRGAWLGCIAYVASLVGVALAISNGVVRLDAFETGDLDSARVQAGQWWRAWTALTLHADGPHLAANLGAGVWFGYLAARQLGNGIAWLLIVTGAAVSNLLEGSLGPPEHHSIGASTAVFTALGVMAAYSWRERYQLPQRWARRWGPLVAGVILLGWFGSSGENTDLVAHVGGFVIGAILGATASLPVPRRVLDRIPQWLAGVAALGSIAVAWLFALKS